MNKPRKTAEEIAERTRTYQREYKRKRRQDPEFRKKELEINRKSRKKNRERTNARQRERYANDAEYRAHRLKLGEAWRKGLHERIAELEKENEELRNRILVDEFWQEQISDHAELKAEVAALEKEKAGMQACLDWKEKQLNAVRNGDFSLL